MKDGIKKVIVVLALLIPSYFLSSIVCMLVIYVYAQITGLINESGAGALPFIAIPVGFVLSPIVSVILTYKIFKK